MKQIRNRLTLTNDISNIPLLAEFVEAIAEELELDMEISMSLNLALEEAVVNVMNYAYPKDTKGDILIDALTDDDRLKFVITDQGVAFDPTAKDEVDTSLSAEERPIGGLGIHLVRQLMDNIEYERKDGNNILTLSKIIPNS
jgi:sigma-B regulation protein RsbU (phosphoserine phosphatase)